MLRRQELTQITEKQIKRDEYYSWLESPVTQRFMAEAELELLSLNENHGSAYASTVDQVALAYREKAARTDTLETFLGWIPIELAKSEE